MDKQRQLPKPKSTKKQKKKKKKKKEQKAKNKIISAFKVFHIVTNRIPWAWRTSDSMVIIWVGEEWKPNGQIYNSKPHALAKPSLESFPWPSLKHFDSFSWAPRE